MADDRSIVAPAPSILIDDEIAGSALGPYQWLSAAVNVYAQPGARSSRSGAAVVFAASIAAIRSSGSHATAVTTSSTSAAPRSQAAPCVRVTPRSSVSGQFGPPWSTAA